MTPAELLMEDERLPFGSLACVLVENTEAAEGQLYPQPGPQDEDYIRGQVPMTKKEVRRISLDKLCIGSQAVCYDIGAGTGSVAVEMGMDVRQPHPLQRADGPLMAFGSGHSGVETI